MPMYDYMCPEGHLFEGLEPVEVTQIPCKICAGWKNDSVYTRQQRAGADFAHKAIYHRIGGIAYRVLLAAPAWKMRNANPLGIVVHKDAKGNYRFPGRADAQVPVGFEAIEVHDVAHARRIERDVDRQAAEKAGDLEHAKRVHFDAERKKGEEEIRGRMSQMDPRVQALAEVAFKANREREAEKSTRIPEANSGFEALSYDKTNRQDHRDERSGWSKVAE